MKFLYSWLQKHINLNEYSVQQVADYITNHSSEVETVQPIHDYFDEKVVVAKITQLRKHPNADRLYIFDAAIGNNTTVQIVTAATNVKENMLVPIALVGARLPQIVIAERSMRGETSYGMCCGATELLLEPSSDQGVLELDCSEDAVGKSICAIYPTLFTPDYVLDIKILPDRIGNIGNYIGMSHEIARILRKPDLLQGIAKKIFYGESLDYPLYPRDTDYTTTFEDNTGLCQIFDIVRAQLAHPYELPSHIQKMLFLSGIESSDPLTALSHYCMYETGQPIQLSDVQATFHTHTPNTLQIKEITNQSNFISTHQQKPLLLPSGTCVLSHEQKIMSIPAVTQEKGIKVGENTQDIAIELAMFDSTKAMKNAFLVGYRPESLKIWASRSHPSRIGIALILLNQLLPQATFSILLTSTNGKQDCTDIPSQLTPFLSAQPITIDWDYLNTSFAKQGIQNTHTIFTPLLPLLGTITQDTLTPYSPTYTFCESKENLLQELSYIAGVNTIAPTSPQVSLVQSNPSSQLTRILALKKYLVSLGFTEIITRPFTQHGDIRILKSMNASMDYLRSDLLTSLLPVAQQNTARGYNNIALFECNKLYSKTQNSFEEKQGVALIFEESIASSAVSIVSLLAQHIGQRFLHAAITAYKDNLGEGYKYQWKNVVICLLQLNNKIKKQYHLPLHKSWWVITTTLDTIQPPITTHLYRDIPNFPAVYRDYSLSLPATVLWKDIYQYLPKQYKSTQLDYLVKDEAVIDTTKKITLQVTMTNPSATLNSKDIQIITQEITNSLQSLQVQID